MNQNLYTITLDDDPLMHKIIAKVTDMPSISFLDAKSLLDQLKNLHPLGAFVDIHLGQDQNGLDFVKQLRLAWPYQPIIVMTADMSKSIIGQALAAGADDFIRKPIDPAELVARFQARMCALSAKAQNEILHLGDLALDTLHKKLNGPKGEAYLSPTEVELLAFLFQARGTVVQKNVLKRRLWGDVHVSDNALNRKIFEVRRAVDEVSQNVGVRSIYGVGLSIEVS